MKIETKNRILKALLIVLIFVAFALAVYLPLKLTGVLDKISSLDELKTIIKDAGIYSWAIFFALQFAQVVLLPIPAIVTTLAGVWVFGPWLTFLISFVAVFSASIFAFVLGKKLGKGIINWLVGKQSSDKWSKTLEKGKYVFFLMMLFPIFPDDIMCLVAGTTSLSYTFFIITNIITRPIAIITTCFFGSGQLIPFSGWGIPVWIVLILLMALAFYISIKYQTKIENIITKLAGKISSKTNKEKTQMKNIAKLIKKSKSVAIFGHISPDPDCMGSMQGLAKMLNQKGIKTTVFVDTDKTAEEYPLFAFDNSFNKDIDTTLFDTLITVDVATKRLLGKYGDAFESFENTISIDHHGSRDLKAKEVYCEPHSSSCSEIIFKFAKVLKAKVTPEIAHFLFAGIIGDTACFEHDNVTPQTHAIASKLYECGADTKNIIFELKKKQSFADIKLRNLVYEAMVMKDQIAYVIFTKEMLEKAGSDRTKHFVPEMLNIEDNIFAFGISEKEDGKYSVSIRCKNGYNACEIAEKYDGGGHKQAAGLAFVGDPKVYAEKLFNDCKAQIKAQK